MLLLCSYLLQESSDSLPEIYTSYPLQRSQVSPAQRSLPWPLWLGQIYVVFLKHLGFFPSWFMSPLPFHFNFYAPLIYLPLSAPYSVREGIMLVFAHHRVSASCLVRDRFSVLNKYLLINAWMEISGKKKKTWFVSKDFFPPRKEKVILIFSLVENFMNKLSNPLYLFQETKIYFCSLMCTYLIYAILEATLACPIKIYKPILNNSALYFSSINITINSTSLTWH